RDSTIQPKDASSSNGSINSKHLKRQSKNSTNTTATTTGSSNKDSFRNSGAESVSHASTAPSLPTPVTASAAHGTFGDEASEAIVNLKIVDSPPAASNGARFGGQAQNSEPAMRLADDSDDDSESDAPLGSIVTRLAQTMGSANGANMMQQQQQLQQMQMQRASAAITPMSGPAQMMGMQQPGMIAHTQSMYGAMPNTNTANMVQMFPQQQQQQQQMFAQDPSQMMMNGGMPMPYQNSPSIRGRPNTYMDPAGGAWGQQPAAMGMNMGGMGMGMGMNTGMNMNMNMGMGMGMDNVGGPLLTVEKKVDPIERPTGLVGAIATREQMKSEQKYRDSSSLMKERQMRRNQAMGMNNAIYNQQPGARFGGGQGFPSMYGAPQGWNDDTMSMMSGMSGRAPYAQIAPSLSAEQLSGPYMRGTMYGGVPQPGMQMAGAMANDEDDVALSVYAGGIGNGGNRLSMAAPDVHPLRAAMQSGMSASSPHLVTSMNPYSQHQQQQLQLQLLQQQQQIQQLQLQQLQQQQQPANAFGDQQQRRMSVAGPISAPLSNGRNGLAHTISAGTSLSYNQLNSRHSVVSSNSGSGSSGNDSLTIQPRASANRWVKESSNLRVESGMRGKDSAKASTMPRPRGPSSAARNNVTSVYELPGRSSAVRIAEPAKPSARASAFNARYSSDDDDDEDEDNSGDDDNLGYSSSKKVSKELKQFFNVFADKCLDVKPYAWVDFSTAFDAYKSFCNRNGLRGTEVATSSQFQDLMEAAEWQLKTRDSGARAYYNTCLI
ncbi:hypothetical protein LPJ56_002001, partial [Coemansia sp. RSA 2599]